MKKIIVLFAVIASIFMLTGCEKKASFAEQFATGEILYTNAVKEWKTSNPIYIKYVQKDDELTMKNLGYKFYASDGKSMSKEYRANEERDKEILKKYSAQAYTEAVEEHLSSNPQWKKLDLDVKIEIFKKHGETYFINK